MDENSGTDWASSNGPEDGEREPAAQGDGRPAADGTQASVDERRVMSRRDVYTRPIVEGREVSDNFLTRLRWRLRELITPAVEREELVLETTLRECGPVSKTNTIAVISPKGGVGKTATTFWVGNLLAEEAKLRVLCVDANPDFGTLAALAPDETRSERTLADLLTDMYRLGSAASIGPYVSRLDTGLHLLASPANADAMAEMNSERYEELFNFLARFYEVILLDCGTEIVGSLAQFALSRADQVVIVTTPEWVTASTVLSAQRHIQPERATLVLNRTVDRHTADREILESHFRRHMLGAHVAVPEDQQLRTMLDSGTYSLEGLGRQTRLSIKRLGVAVGQQLV